MQNEKISPSDTVLSVERRLAGAKRALRIVKKGHQSRRTTAEHAAEQRRYLTHLDTHGDPYSQRGNIEHWLAYYETLAAAEKVAVKYVEGQIRLLELQAKGSTNG